MHWWYMTTLSCKVILAHTSSTFISSSSDQPINQVEGKISFVMTDFADNTNHSLEWLNVS